MTRTASRKTISPTVRMDLAGFLRQAGIHHNSAQRETDDVSVRVPGSDHGQNLSWNRETIRLDGTPVKRGAGSIILETKPVSRT